MRACCSFTSISVFRSKVRNPSLTVPSPEAYCRSAHLHFVSYTTKFILWINGQYIYFKQCCGSVTFWYGLGLLAWVTWRGILHRPIGPAQRMSVMSSSFLLHAVLLLVRHLGGNGLVTPGLLYWLIDRDPYLWLTDPDPDPAIFVSDLQDTNKK